MSDFYFTGDDYRYRFEVDAKQRYIDLIRERFNCGVAYKGRVMKWDTVIEEKTNELGRFLTGKRLSLDFVEPLPKLERQDSRELRTKILALTALQAKQCGIGKSTLHNLRKEVESGKPFRVYSRARKKLANLGGAS